MALRDHDLIVVDLVGAHWREVDWTMLPALPVAAGLRWVQVPELACVLAAHGHHDHAARSGGLTYWISITTLP